MALNAVAARSTSRIAGLGAPASRVVQRCSTPVAFTGLRTGTDLFAKRQASLYTARQCSKGRIVAAASEEDVAKVAKIIAGQLAKEAATIEGKTTFKELEADSLDTVEIMMALEEEFGVELDEEKAGSITTVQEAADLIAGVKATTGV